MRLAILAPQNVHDTAAFLFWMTVAQIGLSNAEEAVNNSAGECLLNQKFSDAILRQHGTENLPRITQREFAKAIASEAAAFVAKGANMNGTVYADDALTGRSPSAQLIDTTPLKLIPKRISRQGDFEIEKSGRLCLRHPLPAVLFSDSESEREIVEVANTLAALGFHLPMFLSNISRQRISEELFLLTGIFHIPVPDRQQGAMWDSVILNSTRFVEGMSFYGKDCITQVNVEWK
jgi:hypothetical protein